MVTLRRAEAGDGAVLARIHETALADGSSVPAVDRLPSTVAPGQYRSPAILEDDDCTVYVAEDDGTVIGWGAVYLDPEVLAVLFVHPDRATAADRVELKARLEELARDAGAARASVLVY